MFIKTYIQKTIVVISLSMVTMYFSGCADKTPLLPPMSPVKLDSKTVSNMTKEEIQSLVSKMMNQKVAAAGGSQYLQDPKHLAISITGSKPGLADGQIEIWNKRAYSYAYGYYYDANKSEVIEVPVSSCINSWLSGRDRKVHTYQSDCEEYLSLYYPGEDFKNTILAFRRYLSEEFPNFIANYNSKKIK